MIKVSDGAVSISGATVDIIKELSMAIYGVYESLVDRYDDETACTTSNLQNCEHTQRSNTW